MNELIELLNDLNQGDKIEYSDYSGKNGRRKKVKETYLVEAFNLTDVEAEPSTLQICLFVENEISHRPIFP